MERVQPLETVIWRAPLGLRFVDLARLVPVADGLRVTATPLVSSGGGVAATPAGPAIPALRSPVSGIYGFRSLPGLRDLEFPDPDLPVPTGPIADEEPTGADFQILERLRDALDAGEGPGPEPNFQIAVSSESGHFLPQRHLMQLPRTLLVDVPLFSAPARPAPAGMVAVRGELWQEADPAPADSATAVKAAWAYVTATVEGVLGTDGSPTFVGVADARGVFTLFVPRLAGPRTRVTLRVNWQPTALRPPPDPGSAEPPDLRSILEQAPASIVDRRDEDPTDSVTRDAAPGGDLVVKTKGRKSALRVIAAGP